MIIDCDLITYYTAEEILPYPQYTSGEQGDGAIYRFAKPSKTDPVLIVEEDIIFQEGPEGITGIKNGFYQTVLSEDFDFLMLFEAGNLRAKIPVVSITQKNDVAPVKQKVVKKKRRNNKGKDSEEFIHQHAQIYFDPPNNSFVLIYERGNTKAVGVIKL